MALAQKNVQWIQRVIDDFSTGRVPDWTKFRECVRAELPAETNAGGPNRAPQSGDTGAGGGSGGGGGATGSGGKGKRKVGALSLGGASYGSANPPDFTKAWADDVLAVHTSHQGFAHGRIFFPSQEKLENLLGREFLALVPENGPSACGSYFLLGKCRSDCARGHQIKGTTSQQVLAGIGERMKSHCRALVQEKNG